MSILAWGKGPVDKVPAKQARGLEFGSPASKSKPSIAKMF